MASCLTPDGDLKAREFVAVINTCPATTAAWQVTFSQSIALSLGGSLRQVCGQIRVHSPDGHIGAELHTAILVKIRSSH